MRLRRAVLGLATACCAWRLCWIRDGVRGGGVLEGVRIVVRMLSAWGFPAVRLSQQGPSESDRQTYSYLPGDAGRLRYFPLGNCRRVPAFPAAGPRHFGRRALRAPPQLLAVLCLDGWLGIGRRRLHHGLDRTQGRRKRPREMDSQAAAPLSAIARAVWIRRGAGLGIDRASGRSSFFAGHPDRRRLEISAHQIADHSRHFPIPSLQRGRITRGLFWTTHFKGGAVARCATLDYCAHHRLGGRKRLGRLLLDAKMTRK